MNKILILMLAMLLSVVGVSAHSSHVNQGPVYGVHPITNDFYERYPTHGYGNTMYGHTYAGTSMVHSYGIKSYLGTPRMHPSGDWYAGVHSAIVHSYRRPLLYPGIYRFY